MAKYANFQRNVSMKNKYTGGASRCFRPVKLEFHPKELPITRVILDATRTNQPEVVGAEPQASRADPQLVGDSPPRVKT